GPGGRSLPAAWRSDARRSGRRPQMKGAATFAAIAALIVVLVVLLSAAFTVEQTEQAILLRFGEPVAGRGLVTTPGLHFKYPFNKPIELSVLEKAPHTIPSTSSAI